MVGVNIDGLMKTIFILAMFSVIIALFNPENWFNPVLTLLIGGSVGFVMAHDKIIIK